MSNCEHWITKLHALYRQIQPLCGQDAKLTISPPGTYLDVEEVEAEIGRSLPAELKDLFTYCAAKIDFSWSLWPSRHLGLSKPLPEELGEVTFGRLDLDLKALPNCWVNWTAWEDCFENPDEYEGGESSYEFDDLFPFLSLPNGDVIALVRGAMRAVRWSTSRTRAASSMKPPWPTVWRDSWIPGWNWVALGRSAGC